jgi:hypothetical protein
LPRARTHAHKLFSTPAYDGEQDETAFNNETRGVAVTPNDRQRSVEEISGLYWYVCYIVTRGKKPTVRRLKRVLGTFLWQTLSKIYASPYPLVSYFVGNSDYEGWTDIYNRPCSEYDTALCASEGNTGGKENVQFKDVTANEACIVCGACDECYGKVFLVCME